VKRNIVMADFFSGSGQFTQGVVDACAKLGITIKRTVAINHNADACATYRANFPGAEVYQSRVEANHPWELFPDKRLDVLIAAAECTYHSRALGGRPVNNQSRMSGLDVVRWAEAVDITAIILENVAEWIDWGPTVRKKYFNKKTKKYELGYFPDKKRKGEVFQELLAFLRVLGYRIEYRVLRSADYGDPTTRQRVFVLAHKKRQPRFPEPTHSKMSAPALFFQRAPWVPARDIIDWEIKSPSIFFRSDYGKKYKDLSPNTMQRIATGLERFSGLEFKVTCAGDLVLMNGKFEPFVVSNRGGDDGYLRGSSIHLPVGAITGKNPMAIVTPDFMLPPEGYYRGNAPRDVGEMPFPTITAARGGGHLVESRLTPLMLGQQSQATARPDSQPVPTVAGRGAIGLCESAMIVSRGTDPAQLRSSVYSVNDTVPTIATKAHIALADYIVQVAHTTGAPRLFSPDEPMPVVDTKPCFYLASPSIVQYHGGEDMHKRVLSVEETLPTIDTGNRYSLVQPSVFSIDAGDAIDIDEKADPWKTLVRKLLRYKENVIRFGETVGLKVLLPTGQIALLEIRYRMFVTPELARANGFKRTHIFHGTDTSVRKQIGNAVTLGLATALAYEHLQL